MRLRPPSSSWWSMQPRRVRRPRQLASVWITAAPYGVRSNLLAAVGRLAKTMYPGGIDQSIAGKSMADEDSRTVTQKYVRLEWSMFRRVVNSVVYVLRSPFWRTTWWLRIRRTIEHCSQRCECFVKRYTFVFAIHVVQSLLDQPAIPLPRHVRLPAHREGLLLRTRNCPNSFDLRQVPPVLRNADASLRSRYTWRCRTALLKSYSCRMSLKSCCESNRAIHGRRPSCCRWCTRSCGSWPPNR